MKRALTKIDTIVQELNKSQLCQWLMDENDNH